MMPGARLIVPPRYTGFRTELEEPVERVSSSIDGIRCHPNDAAHRKLVSS